MPAASSSTASPVHEHAAEHGCSLFVTRQWFEVLERYGMPDHVRHHLRAGPGDAPYLPLMQADNTLRSLSSYYSADYGLVDGAVPSSAQAVELARGMRALGAASIELRPLRSDAPLLRALMPALRQCGYVCDSFHVTTNWYLPCAGLSWTDYLASRPSRLANTLRRCGKRLAEQGHMRLEILSAPDGLDAALAAYASVYAQSWKEPEPYPEFIPRLCRMSAEHGWLRFGVLHVGDVPAAAQIWFVKDGAASIYKLAYDSRFARLGVGTVLTAALAEHVLDVDKVHEIDFLTGDDAYKAEWMSHSRELVGLLAFNTRSPLGLLRAARHFGGRWLGKLKSKEKPADPS